MVEIVDARASSPLLRAGTRVLGSRRLAPVFRLFAPLLRR
jgi:hypothetical protein